MLAKILLATFFERLSQNQKLLLCVSWFRFLKLKYSHSKMCGGFVNRFTREFTIKYLATVTCVNVTLRRYTLFQKHHIRSFTSFPRRAVPRRGISTRPCLTHAALTCKPCARHVVDRLSDSVYVRAAPESLHRLVHSDL